MSQAITLFAPGSLTHILPIMLEHFDPQIAQNVRCVFGPSGALRDRIESGEYFDLYFSAVKSHGLALQQSGYFAQSSILGFNPTVLVYRSELLVTPETVLKTLSDPSLSLAMSTTGLDPESETLELLEKIAGVIGVNPTTLYNRCRLITGGRENPNAPSGRNQYGWIMEHQDVSLLLTVHSNALAALEDNPNLSYCALPQSVSQIETYVFGLSNVASEQACALYKWLLEMDAQELLQAFGFSPVSKGV